MSIKIVIGAGFGDEGKGLTTSYLCSRATKPLVIRFSGGQQAGHTVVHNGHRHVFSNFGSGTLQGAPTYWSEYCTFSPLGVLNEYNALKEIGIDPTLYVNPLCPVTTPYDRAFNCNLEKQNQHGSCGVGVGATFQRQDDFYKLYVQDLFYEKVLLQKLANIKNYYAKKMSILPAFIDNVMNVKLDDFLYIVDKVKKIIHVNNGDMLLSSVYDLIFEGSQGILLDQDFGFFPNVTRSNTTAKNALAIINKKRTFTDRSQIEIYYVTRAYQTRHGNGFMTNEGMIGADLSNYNPNEPATMKGIDGLLKNNELETNVTNEWQGDFRKSILDMDLLNYAIGCDNNFSRDIKKNLVITCLDQIGERFPVTINNETHYLNPVDFFSKLPAYIGKIFVSRGDSRDKISEVSMVEES